MTTFDLYLESGPRRKKTMVHVLALLGCIANGPTTDEALARTPAAIGAFQRFLARHGEPVDLAQPIETRIAAHIMEGVWLGNGDPSIVFEPDLLPLTADDGERFIARLEWMGAEMNDLLGDLSPDQLVEKPPEGRPIQTILEHILESEYSYVYAFGRLEELPALGSIVEKRQGNLLSWLGVVRAKEIERLRALTDQERSEPFIHWKYTRTARKVMRRMLEHQWEHLLELKERIESGD
jgi:uncharacterized damage-inducible protein DinB/predicted RNase H-like HicB family nuclease